MPIHCHFERSEKSLFCVFEILRCAQYDNLTAMTSRGKATTLKVPPLAGGI